MKSQSYFTKCQVKSVCNNLIQFFKAKEFRSTTEGNIKCMDVFVQDGDLCLRPVVGHNL